MSQDDLDSDGDDEVVDIGSLPTLLHILGRDVGGYLATCMTIKNNLEIYQKQPILLVDGHDDITTRYL